jgi:hypothetical protein
MKTGHSEMLEFDSSYNHHHLPVWFKKVIREVALFKNRWNPGECHYSYFLRDSDFRGLWDHWGSINTGKYRSVITQPYGDHSGLAIKFAKEHGLELFSNLNAPWHPNTRLYIFSKAISTPHAP